MSFRLPEGAVKYAETKTFTQDNIPAKLLKNHSTKPRSWGLIVLDEGELIYTIIDQPPILLTPQNPGVIRPGELHKIAAQDDVTFRVEFYHDPAADAEARDQEEVHL